jgi:replication initiation protein RepC
MKTSGARPLSRARLHSRQLQPRNGALSREELFDACRLAIRVSDISSNAAAVLWQLVGCWGENPNSGRMIVWPGNETLAEDTKLCERAVRYAIKELMEAGLLTDKPSPNQKRYLDLRTGEAYGLDLTPLAARKAEFETRHAMIRAYKAQQGALKREITIQRRAIEEALTALANEFPELSRDDIEGDLASLRGKTRGELTEELLALWITLKTKAERRFYHAATPGTQCSHIESNLESESFTCMAPEEEPVETPERKPVAVELVVKACPAATAMAGRSVATPADLVAAGEFLRPQIGISPDAWREAKELVGLVDAAATVFYTVQMMEKTDKRKPIDKPGGWFRNTIRRQHARHFSLEATLMEMWRKNRGS